MNVTLLAHTQISDYMKSEFLSFKDKSIFKVTDGQIVSLAAIRQCYSHKTATEILETESEKYFGEKGKEGKRLFNQIYNSGHTSTLEHISFTFAIDGVSRSLLAQLTRHRHMSFSVQSQRYNNFSMGSRAEGFTYAIPDTINGSDEQYFDKCMLDIQLMYDKLISLGIPRRTIHERFFRYL